MSTDMWTTIGHGDVPVWVEQKQLADVKQTLMTALFAATVRV